jgi:hypothetical protein
MARKWLGILMVLPKLRRWASWWTVDTLSSVNGDALVEDEADCQASESIDLVVKKGKRECC